MLYTMSVVPYYTRVVVQFVLFIFTKIIILRGRSVSPITSLGTDSHLIAANHRSSLDPFAILASLRTRDFFRLAPFSFMTANAFMRPPWLRPLAWMAGCFPAYPGMGPYGIDKALHDLDQGYTVMIFPEGKRVVGTTTKAKRGVGVILDGSPKTRLILAHIEWRSALSVRSIAIACPPQKTAPTTPDAIMKAIYSL